MCAMDGLCAHGVCGELGAGGNFLLRLWWEGWGFSWQTPPVFDILQEGLRVAVSVKGPWGLVLMYTQSSFM